MSWVTGRRVDGIPRNRDTGEGSGLGVVREADMLSLGHAEFEVPVGHFRIGRRAEIASRRNDFKAKSDISQFADPLTLPTATIIYGKLGWGGVSCVHYYTTTHM